jgi:REP element-mobilizing transposase RayT
MASGIYNKYTGYHRRRSIRLREYDYSRPGYYFVTICIHDRTQYLFGDIVRNEMVLNDIGKIAERCWQKIPSHFPHVKIDEFIVMPNHMHGIIHMGDSFNIVGVQNFEPLRKTNPLHNKFRHIIPRSIGSIVRGFKIGVTKLVREREPGMVVWQRNYYDHIIRDENSLHLIRNYIRNNPARWDSDHENHIDLEIREFESSEPQGFKMQGSVF